MRFHVRLLLPIVFVVSLVCACQNQPNLLGPSASQQNVKAEFVWDPATCAITLFPVEDTVVSERFPWGNFSGLPRLFVNGKEGNRAYSLLRFGGVDLPAGTAIRSATLKLGLVDLPLKGDDSVTITRVLDQWSAAATNWIKRPMLMGVTKRIGTVSDVGIVEVDVTAYVSLWVNDRSLDASLAIHPGNSDVLAASYSGDSNETHSFRPQIEVLCTTVPIENPKSTADGDQKQLEGISALYTGRW